MALTDTQKARLAEFSTKQEANKVGSTATVTPTTTPTTTATPVKPTSIQDTIKAQNSGIIQQVTPSTQVTVPKPNNIQDTIKAQNSSIIAQANKPISDNEKAVDEAVNYANSLYNQNNTDIGLNDIKTQEQGLAQQALTFQQESMKLLDSFSSQFNSSYEDLYKETVDSEKFLQQEKEMAGQKASIEELDLQIEGVENDVRNELQGKASESAIQQRVAQRVRDLNKQRARLVDDYTQIYDIYSSEKQEAIQLLGMRVADQQQQEQRQWKVFEQKLGMTQKSFEMQWSLAMK